jgi:hypothetical protein
VGRGAWAWGEGGHRAQHVESVVGLPARLGADNLQLELLQDALVDEAPRVGPLVERGVAQVRCACVDEDH